MKNQYDNLVKIIYNDLRVHGKLQLSLLILIMITAILIIVITYKTRCMVINHEKLLLEISSLNHEWHRLMLDEKILSNHVRIENIALNKLHMHYENPILDDLLS